MLSTRPTWPTPAAAANALGVRPSPGNRVLQSLQPDVARRLAPHLVRVRLAATPASSFRCAFDRYVYFPETCVVSLMSVASGGSTIGAALIAGDGVVDGASSLARAVASLQLVVHVAGDAQRIAVDAIDPIVASSPSLQAAMLHESRRLALQVALTATCGALHSVRERCIRALLSLRACAGADAFFITQETLAAIVGARRAGISVAMQSLHDAGWVAYRRGTIRILNVAGLESAACSCVASLGSLGATRIGPA